MMIEVFGMSELEKVRYTAHIKEDMNTLGDAVAKYREAYQKFFDASEKSLLMLDRVALMYKKVRETQRYDIAFMKEALG